MKRSKPPADCLPYLAHEPWGRSNLAAMHGLVMASAKRDCYEQEFKRWMMAALKEARRLEGKGGGNVVWFVDL